MYKLSRKNQKLIARTTRSERKRAAITPSTPVAATTIKKLKTDIVELSSGTTG